MAAGDKIAQTFLQTDNRAAALVIPRSINKFASKKTKRKWAIIQNDKKMSMELREIGRSIANIMRPIAGNYFTNWVATILNEYLRNNAPTLVALTKGETVQKLSKQMKIGRKDVKPDIDIVLAKKGKQDKPVAIISCKTLLAERVLQTISWARFIKGKRQYRRIRIYLVTAWEDFESGANVDRVQELDGVYVCNESVKEKGKVKKFSRIGPALQRLAK